MEIPILIDIVVIFGLAIVVSFICSRISIPPIVGFLLTGTIAGPYGLSLVSAGHEVEIMAEIGVILLLFSIGLEFSIQHLLQIRRAVTLGGTVQVLLTGLATFAIATALDTPWNKAVFYGFLTALSSTAIVLNQLQSSAQIDAPHGRTALGILIFQDIIIVPMMIITPLLSSSGGFSLNSLLPYLGKAALLLILIFTGTKWLIPRMFYQIAKTKNRELFLLSIIFVALGIAWFTAQIGLSLALGAFIAGLMIAESEYSHNAISHILPFRDVFMSLFFVSVGMLLDLSVLWQYLPYVGLFLVMLLIVKFISSTAAGLVLGYPLHTALLVGLALAQVGEFSFILAKTGQQYNLISANAYQVFLAVSVLTMLLTPFLIKGHRIASWLNRWTPLPRRIKDRRLPVSKLPPPLTDHLIIIGFGLNGRNLAHAARVANLPYLILELNPQTVRRERKNGEPIYFGDAASSSVLEEMHIDDARVLTVAIPDITATRRIVFLAKLANPDVHVIARTRFVSEIEPLRELGTDEVIAEEFESAIEIFTRVLKRFAISRPQIDALSAEVRAKDYRELRTDDWACTSISDLALPNTEVLRLRLTDSSPWIGQSLEKLSLRQKFRLNLLALVREQKTYVNPDATMHFNQGDELIVLGNPEDIEQLRLKLSAIRAE